MSPPVVLVAGSGAAAVEAAREVVAQGGRAVLVHSGRTGRQCSLRTPPGFEVIEGELVSVEGSPGRFRARLDSVDGGPVVECSAIVLAPGPEDRPATGAMSLYELSSGSVPEGVRSVAFVLREGSPRSSFIGAVRAARELRTGASRPSITVFAGEMTASGTDEIEYRQAQAEGVLFVRSSDPRVTTGPDRVVATDQVTGTEVGVSPDLLVVEVPAFLGTDAIRAAPGGYAVLRGSPCMGTVATVREGVSSPGMEDGRLDAEAITGARAAATRAMTLAMFPLDRASQAAIVDRDRCVACLTCARVCPFGAAHPSEEGKATIDGALCQACGICVGACPGRALSLPSYGEAIENGRPMLMGGRP